MSDAERDTVQWSPGGAEVEIVTGGRRITVGGLADRVGFEAETPDGEMARALWLTENQASVLSKMTAYIIGNLRIRPESKQTLEDLLPDIQALWPEAEE